ncbi:MAG TPA: hypothetical protein VK849_12985, partial [Longimicrobiales bacterium]|nr:hypothetical protein [Longimicrobiales bacterium]
MRTEADTSLATVGDRITLTLAVEHAPDQRVLWPDSLDMAPFEVLGAERVEPSPDGPRGRSALRLTLTTFELGELEIPSVRIGVASPDGTIDTLASSPWGVTVASVGLDEEGDIREIRGPLAIALDWVLLLPWALLALLLLVAFVVWWRRRRRREGPPAPPPPAPRRPAHEVALEALARLEASDLLERGAVKEYHVKVSD